MWEIRERPCRAPRTRAERRFHAGGRRPVGAAAGGSCGFLPEATSSRAGVGIESLKPVSQPRVLPSAALPCSDLPCPNSRMIGSLWDALKMKTIAILPWGVSINSETWVFFACHGWAGHGGRVVHAVQKSEYLGHGSQTAAREARRGFQGFGPPLGAKSLKPFVKQRFGARGAPDALGCGATATVHAPGPRRPW